MDAATGAPIALTDIRDSVVVMATFARGPGWNSKEPLEVQVMFSGACEGVTSLLFPAPAPVVIAHQFLLRVRGQGALCTRGGSSSARAVLLGPNARVLAVSVPLRLVIRQSP